MSSRTRRARVAIIAAFAAALVVSRQPAAARADRPASHALDPALRLAHDSLRWSRENIHDYTAVFVKRLRINGELTDHQFASVKIRNRKSEGGRITVPMAVYLRFLEPARVRGREVIWVEGENNGKLVAHEAGFKNFLRVHLDPAGFVAMRGQRYPISDIGLENLLVKMIKSGERDRQYGECEVSVFENARVGESECRMVQVVHPIERPHFSFYRARVYFDKTLNVPVRYASWSWPVEEDGQPLLEEEYTYTKVRVNVGLTDNDFDPDNTSYDFP